jgi:hypothetical protein
LAFLPCFAKRFAPLGIDLAQRVGAHGIALVGDRRQGRLSLIRTVLTPADRKHALRNGQQQDRCDHDATSPIAGHHGVVDVRPAAPQ